MASARTTARHRDAAPGGTQGSAWYPLASPRQRPDPPTSAHPEPVVGDYVVAVEIRPGIGVPEAELGTTRAQVEAHLGTPRSVRDRSAFDTDRDPALVIRYPEGFAIWSMDVLALSDIDSAVPAEDERPVVEGISVGPRVLRRLSEDD